MSAVGDKEDSCWVSVSIDIEARTGTPDQLVEQLVAERNRYYPEWEFDRSGIIIHTMRMHSSATHSATATLTKMVRYRGPDKT